MDLDQPRTCYLAAAERFAAIQYRTFVTRLGDVLSLHSSIAFVRVREDGALVLSVAGEPKIVADGEVIRVNRQTGAVRIFALAEFEETHRVAQ